MKKQIELNVPFKRKDGKDVVWNGATGYGGERYQCIDLNGWGVGWYNRDGSYVGSEIDPSVKYHAEWYTGPEDAPEEKPETEMEEANPAPPLGLKPRHVHETERLDEIDFAIVREVAARKCLNTVWIDEYNELAFKLRG